MIEIKKGRKCPRNGYLLNKKEWDSYIKDKEILNQIEREFSILKEF